MDPKLSRTQANRLEQRTLKVSVVAIVALALTAFVYGLYIQSEVVILDGVFALISLLGSGLYLLAARLVTLPSDRRFQYGYSHIEPLVNSINGLMMLVVCIYAFVNGVEGLRGEGSAVDPQSVIWYSLITGVVGAAVWAYETTVARRIESQLVRNDAREWMISLAFSAVTTIGFAIVFLLPEPWRGLWARYADSALVSLMALLLLPVPLRILHRNLREVLMITATDEVLVGRVDRVMREIRAEHDIVDHSSHIVKIGRIHFIEVNVLVGPEFRPGSVPELDLLRERIWAAVDRPIEEAWLSICFTADRRWS
jgi:cation diffusion facilitator family transporter